MLTIDQLPDNIKSLVSQEPQQATPTLNPPQQQATPDTQGAPVPAPANPATSFGLNSSMRNAMQRAGFGGKLGTAMDNTPVPPEPGGWARSVVGAAQKVLAGVGDISTEPTTQPTSKAGSFFEGLAETSRNQAARQEKAKQQEFQNQRELNKEGQEQQKIDQDKLQSDAIIAYNNSQRIHTERLTHQLDDEAIDASVKADASYRKELEEDGAQEHYKDKTWGDIQEIMGKMKGTDPNHPITLVPIATGRKVVGQQTDENGKSTPLYATTYSLYDAPEKQKLTKEMAQRFNDATNPATPYQEGDEMYGHQINTLQTQWKSQQADKAATSKAIVDAYGSEKGAEIIKEIGTPEFNSAFHDAMVENGYNHPDKTIEALEKKGVANAAQTVAMQYGGQDTIDKILENNNRLAIEKEKEKNRIADDTKVQNQLEQQARTVLMKPLANRSGGLGLEDQKVQQANHLSVLAKQYYNKKTGDFDIPPAQYTELVLGLARLLSPTGVPTADVINNLQSKTTKGDLAGAVQYFNGIFGTKLPTGNTQAIIKNLLESIDRQGGTAVQNREGYMEYLRGLMPTQLDPTRMAKLEEKSLNPYNGIFSGDTPVSQGGVVVNGVRFPDQATADKAMAAWQAQQQQGQNQQQPPAAPQLGNNPTYAHTPGRMN